MLKIIEFNAIIIILLCLSNQTKGQVLTLNNKYTKVDITISKAFLPDEFNIDEDVQFEHDTIIYQDSLTIFYYWFREGVYQIITRQNTTGALNKSAVLTSKENKRINLIETIRWQENGLLFKSKQYPELIELCDMAVNMRESEKYSTSNSMFTSLGTCNIPLICNKGYCKNAKYDIVAIFFYNKSTINKVSSNQLKTLKSKFIVFHPYFNLSNFRWQEKIHNPQDSLFFKRDPINFFKLKESIYAITKVSIYFSDIFFLIGTHPKIFNNRRSFEFPLIDKKKLNCAEVKQFSDENSLTIMQDINGSDCHAYSVKTSSPASGISAIIVVPGKFFISDQVKIISVDDKPWEKYKKKICK